jgi:hypothetical protein
MAPSYAGGTAFYTRKVLLTKRLSKAITPVHRSVVKYSNRSCKFHIYAVLNLYPWTQILELMVKFLGGSKIISMENLQCLANWSMPMPH